MGNKTVFKEIFSKREAILKAEDFLTEVKKLQDKYSLSFNSDTGDIYLSFKSSEDKWDYINIGWEGDGTGMKVMEKTEEDIREEALSKLSDEEKKSLGLL